jgi:hypothetical protein
MFGGLVRCLSSTKSLAAFPPCKSLQGTKVSQHVRLTSVSSDGKHRRSLLLLLMEWEVLTGVASPDATAQPFLSEDIHYN